jgi:hypothetical protein
MTESLTHEPELASGLGAATGGSFDDAMTRPIISSASRERTPSGPANAYPLRVLRH